MSTTKFNGPAEPDMAARETRLSTQHEALRELMSDGHWRTLNTISFLLGQKGIKAPPASVSAQLRHLRKPRFGSYVVVKNHLGQGLYQYRVLPPRAIIDKDST